MKKIKYEKPELIKLDMAQSYGAPCFAGSLPRIGCAIGSLADGCGVGTSPDASCSGGGMFEVSCGEFPA